jgi:hypothetical protein
MAVMVYRLAKMKGLELIEGEMNFTDADSVSEYARQAVAAMKKAEVIQGTGNGEFAPKLSATRAQSAVITYKALKMANLLD